VVKRIPVL